MDRTVERIVEFVLGCDFDQLPDDVRQAARDATMDSLGCAFGGGREEPGRIAIDYARAYAGAGGVPVIGTDLRVPMDVSAFCNGVLVRSLDYNDSYFSPAGGHPSDLFSSALVSAGPGGPSGAATLNAVVVAYEVFSRLMDMVDPSPLGWDSGTFASVGAACAAGKLLGLDGGALGHAIGIAVATGSPLYVTRTGELTMWKNCAVPHGTRVGVAAAHLAALGMVGPGAPFSGTYGLWQQMGPPEAFFHRDISFDGERRIVRRITKKYPSQTHTQGAIELAVRLRDRVVPDDIASMTIETYRFAVESASLEPEKWAPRTRDAADHSIPYLTARGYLDGIVTTDDYAAERLADPAVAALIARMSVVESADATRAYPDQMRTSITITTRAGDHIGDSIDLPPGHADAPLTRDELERKFRTLASYRLGPASLDATVGRLREFEAIDDVHGLLVVTG